MKTTIKDGLLGTITIILIIGAMLVTSYIENHYTMTAHVTNVHGEVVQFTDKYGEVWEIYGNGFANGQSVTLHFYTNGTSTRNDDVITEVK